MNLLPPDAAPYHPCSAPEVLAQIAVLRENQQHVMLTLADQVDQVNSLRRWQAGIMAVLSVMVILGPLVSGYIVYKLEH